MVTLSPMLVVDGGVENFNSGVDELIEQGVLRRVLALTELRFSNSLIEAFWRSMKHQWLFLNTLDSVTALPRYPRRESCAPWWKAVAGERDRALSRSAQAAAFDLQALLVVPGADAEPAQRRTTRLSCLRLGLLSTSRTKMSRLS